MSYTVRSASASALGMCLAVAQEAGITFPVSSNENHKWSLDISFEFYSSTFFKRTVPGINHCIRIESPIDSRSHARLHAYRVEGTSPQVRAGIAQSMVTFFSQLKPRVLEANLEKAVTRALSLINNNPGKVPYSRSMPLIHSRTETHRSHRLPS